MGFVDILAVIVTALCSMLASEFCSWVFVYRTDKYAKAVKKVRSLGPEFLELKRADPASKKVTAMRAELKALGSDTSGSNMKSFVFLAVVHWLTFTILNRSYGGLVIAKLPFEPISLIRGFSHRGLPGDDYTGKWHVISSFLTLRISFTFIFCFQIAGFC